MYIRFELLNVLGWRLYSEKSFRKQFTNYVPNFCEIYVLYTSVGCCRFSRFSFTLFALLTNDSVSKKQKRMIIHEKNAKNPMRTYIDFICFSNTNQCSVLVSGIFPIMSFFFWPPSPRSVLFYAELISLKSALCTMYTISRYY